MRPRPGSHLSSRAAAVALASLLVAGLLSVGPATAHVFTKTDGNDTRSKLDIRASTVSHTSTSVVYKIRTYESWTPASLQNDSSLVVFIDKNNDRAYERCAIIFYASRLRGLLTNCRRQIVRNLPVAKLNPTTAKVTIPKGQTGLVYWWATGTYWEGAAPCRNGCIDYSPNFFPDILHDLVAPNVSMSTTTLRTWENSTTANFTFPFTVNDAHSGIDTWKVQRRRFESTTWVTVKSGTGGGAKSPTIAGTEGTRRNYRVVATDRHGNKKVGPVRRVYIPVDDETLDPGSFSSPPTSIVDIEAFGGSYSLMSATHVFTYSFTPTGSDCTFELIGSGSGTWNVSVTIDGGAPTVLTPPGGGQRRTLYSDSSCGSSYEFTVNSGDGFAVDAVLG
jgi:hypothetical protein